MFTKLLQWLILFEQFKIHTAWVSPIMLMALLCAATLKQARPDSIFLEPL